MGPRKRPNLSNYSADADGVDYHRYGSPLRNEWDEGIRFPSTFDDLELGGSHMHDEETENVSSSLLCPTMLLIISKSRSPLHRWKTDLSTNCTFNLSVTLPSHGLATPADVQQISGPGLDLMQIRVMVCLDLPPHLRYRLENIFLVGIIPGPICGPISSLRKAFSRRSPDSLGSWYELGCNSRTSQWANRSGRCNTLNRRFTCHSHSCWICPP